MPFIATSELFLDVANSFVNDSWVPTANGWWGSSHHSGILESAWETFCYEVKNKSRYFFASPDLQPSSYSDHDEISTLSLLNEIGSGSERLGLIRPLIIGTNYYRIRSGHGHSGYSDVGPPPLGKAGQGRMNPQGISYFYLADDDLVAIAETRLVDGEKASLAKFELCKEIKVLDFSLTMLLPSLFRSENYYYVEMIKFWREFVNQIGKPVGKESSLEYIPTQVLSEYFAKVFRCEDGSKVDGFIYSSVTSSVGNNLVMFPESCSNKGWESVAKLVDVKNILV